MDGTCGSPGEPREPVFNGSYSFNTGEIRHLHPVDYVVLTVILVISCGIGLFHSWNDRQEVAIEEFLLAGRQMHPVTVGLSMTASFVSATGIIGAPGQVYEHTTMYFLNPLGFFFVVVGTAYVYLPVLYRLDVTTAYEYLELRFHKTMRTVVSCLFAIQTTVYLSIVLYAPSLAVNEVTGLNLWSSILTSAVVCTLYTASGGMKAVLWTDAFQVVIMILGLVVLQIGAMILVGSWDDVVQSNIRTNRVLFDDFRLHPSVRYSVWSTTIGFYFTFIGRFGVNQIQIQRALTCNTLRDAKIAVWINFPTVATIFTLGCFIGFYMSAFYENCDPLKAKVVTHSSQLAPLFVMDLLSDYPGIPGFYLASLCCAAMSTLSSAVNSVSGAVFHDCIQNYSPHYIGESNARKTMQLLSVLIGCISLILAFGVSRVRSLFSAAATVSGVAGGPILGVFSLGMFFPWANTTGAAAGFFSSLIIVFCAAIISNYSQGFKSPVIFCMNNCNVDIFGSDNSTNSANDTSRPPSMPKPEKLPYYIAFTWFAVIAFVSCIVIGLIVSFVTGPRDPKTMSPRLMVMFGEVFPFTYLPKSVRRMMRLGVPYKDPLWSWPPSSGLPSAATSYIHSRQGSLGGAHPSIHLSAKDDNLPPLATFDDTGSSVDHPIPHWSMPRRF